MTKDLRATWSQAVFRAVLCFTLLVSVSGAAFGQALKQASIALAAKMGESQRKTVAVVDFTDLCNQVPRLGRYLAEELSGALVGDAKGFRVVDRAHLQAILQEHKLAATGLVDPQTVKQLGQFAGVDTLVTGTINSAFGDSVLVMLKALDVTTAEIVAQSTADIPKTDAIKNLIGPDSEGSCGASAAPSNPKPEPQPSLGGFITPGGRGAAIGGGGGSPIVGSGGGSRGAIQPVAQPQVNTQTPVFETESYRVSVDSVRRSGRSLTLTLTFQNISDKKISLSWGMFYDFAHPTDRGPYLLDDNGDKWAMVSPDDAAIVWQPGFGAKDLPPGTRLRTRLTFSGTGTGKTFTLVCKEGAPLAGRDIQIDGLTPN